MTNKSSALAVYDHKKLKQCELTMIYVSQYANISYIGCILLQFAKFVDISAFHSGFPREKSSTITNKYIAENSNSKDIHSVKI